jgi:hypothetical protein
VRRSRTVNTRNLWWRAVAVPTAALALSLGLTACGGDGGGSGGDGDVSAIGNGSTGGGGSGGRGGPSTEEVLAWYDCMRDNGVDLPDPDPDRPGIMLPPGSADDPDMEAAREACQDKLPGGGPGNAEPMDADQLAQMREFTQCLRDNGIDIADPDSTGALTMPEGVDPQGPEFQGAMDECQEFAAGLPMRIQPPGSGQ